jgi:hypothetical protein
MAVSAQSADWQQSCQTSSQAFHKFLTVVERVFGTFGKAARSGPLSNSNCLFEQLELPLLNNSN